MFPNRPAPATVASVALSLALAAGCERAPAESFGAPGGASAPVPPVSVANPPPYKETVHRAYPSLGMNTGLRDAHGTPVRAPCGTCHAHLAPQDKYQLANRLEQFHTGVEIAHGGQSCRTCHAVPEVDRFRLASGELITYDRVMELCGQCHAQRLIQYRNGAHGGMTGFWDRNRGPRTRNHCIDCHNPHAPAVPRMVPAPRPRYRAQPESSHVSE